MRWWRGWRSRCSWSYQPTVAIPGFVAARSSEAAFWMCAAAGAALPAPAVVQSPRLDGLSWPGVTIVLVVLLIVWLLVPGVPLP